MARKRSLGLWYRLYVSILDNTKIEALSDANFRIWTKLNAIATMHGGVIPGDVTTLAIMCRRTEGKVRDAMQVLLSGNLMERLGEDYTPHDWEEMQYDSDVSTNRVKAFRERSKRSNETRNTVSETPNGTPNETLHPYVGSSSSTESSSSDSQNAEGKRAPEPARPPSKPVRGTRWTESATVPVEWHVDAENARARNKLPPVDIALEAEKFANHWASSTKANAVKSNWKKAFINWVLGAREANGTGPRAQQQGSKLGAIFDGMVDAANAMRAREGDDRTDHGAPVQPRALLPPARAVEEGREPEIPGFLRRYAARA